MDRKVVYNVVCDCCGKAFTAHDKRKRYCSHRCRDVDYRQKQGHQSKLEPHKRQCAVCGKDFETNVYTKMTCSSECSKELRRRRDRNRNNHSKEGYNRIRKEQAKQNAEKRALEKAWYKALHTVERECVECGALFYCLDSENKKTCSVSCSKKYAHRKADKRIPPKQRVDKISLKRLYKRDEGTCYLCGELCDWKDWKTSSRGNPYPGDKYPTIEHIVPVSKGGLDAWDNVRLAHWKCNLDKADGIVKIRPMTKEFAYSQKFSATQAKKTAQYTLNGELIKVWDSTGQIERELGLRSKRIQDVCRGCNSNTGNAYGYHWEYVV